MGGLERTMLKRLTRSLELRVMQKAGVIQGLERNVLFNIIPVEYGAVSYRADFTYWRGGKFIVEDCRRFRSKDYPIKKTLMRYFHNIKIKEV